MIRGKNPNSSACGYDVGLQRAMSSTSVFDPAAIWDIPAGANITPLDRGGYNNKLFRVDVAGQAPLVMRIYGNHANPKYIQHEMVVLMHLAQQKLPFAVPAPVLTRRGEPSALVGNTNRQLIVLIPLIPGVNPSPLNLEHAEAVGEAVAILVNAMRKIDARGLRLPQPFNQLGQVHPLIPDPFAAMDCLGSLVPKDHKVRINALLDTVIDSAAKIYRALPSQLIHGDLIPGNLLIDQNRITGVLDFEACALNPSVMEVAIALDTWLWDALGTGKEWERLSRFGVGYTKVGRLSQVEIEAIPMLVLLRNAHVLMHMVGRFVGNLSPYIDVESWIESTLNIDAWMTLNRRHLVEAIAGWG